MYLSILHWSAQHTPWNILNGFRKRALDAGCAYGYVVELLKDLGYEAIGLDRSTYAVMKGKKDKLDLFVGDAQNIAFKDGIFDLITCFELIEHLPKPRDTFNEINRLLRPNGVAVITAPLRGSIQELYDLIGGEHSHISLMSFNEWKNISSCTFKMTVYRQTLLLPIPPNLFNKYFVIPCFGFPSHINIVGIKRI